MPIFLTMEQVYRVLQRELPEDVYADGAPSAFYTTADMGSIAEVIGTAYSNLERVYDNYFPETAEEKLDDWEVKVFGKVLYSALSVAERRDRIIAKVRFRAGITKADIENVVTQVLGTSVDFDIITWNCGADGAWMLDYSALDLSTFLNAANGGEAFGPLLCSQDWNDWGLTEAQWLEMKEQAYTYEVRIFNQTLTPEERNLLDQELNKAEPARSQHVITSLPSPLEFAGFLMTTSYVSLGTSIFNPEWNNSWTVSSWFRGTAVNNFPYVINSANPNQLELDPFLQIQPSAGAIYIQLFNNLSNQIIIEADDVVGMLDFDWHHIAVSYDGSGLAPGLKIYFDGVLQMFTIYENSLSGHTIVSPVATLLGAIDTAPMPEGYLDEFGIYNGAVLTGAEILEIYDLGRAGSLADLASFSVLTNWYRFAGNANDSKGTGDGISNNVTYSE